MPFSSLAALDQAPIEALRTLFLEDHLASPMEKSEKLGGLWDRQGNYWVVFDVDGEQHAARRRSLPCTPDRPVAQRRLSQVCTGYTGRKRGSGQDTNHCVPGPYAPVGRHVCWSGQR
jgi:hypothetical protein